eukprot:2292845-Prymnesium_polylepis.2
MLLLKKGRVRFTAVGCRARSPLNHSKEDAMSAPSEMLGTMGMRSCAVLHAEFQSLRPAILSCSTWKGTADS